MPFVSHHWIGFVARHDSVSGEGLVLEQYHPSGFAVLRRYFGRSQSPVLSFHLESVPLSHNRQVSGVAVSTLYYIFIFYMPLLSRLNEVPHDR